MAGLDFSDHRHSIREQQGAGLSPTLFPAGELDQRPHRSCVGDGDSHLIPELHLRQSPAHRRPEGLRDAGGGHTDVTRGALPPRLDSAGPRPCGWGRARLRGRAGTCEPRDEAPASGLAPRHVAQRGWCCFPAPTAAPVSAETGSDQIVPTGVWPDVGLLHTLHTRCPLRNTRVSDFHFL